MQKHFEKTNSFVHTSIAVYSISEYSSWSIPTVVLDNKEEGVEVRD